MKIARCAVEAREFWAVLDLERNIARQLCGGTAEWAPALTARKSSAPFSGIDYPLDRLRLLPPVEPVNKIVCVGMNYESHVVEAGMKLPDGPVAFLKPHSAMIGQDDEIAYPALTNALDYEIELVLVTGADRLNREAPSSSILGYTIGNDVTARDLVKSPMGGVDLFSAKIHDRTSGLGPWIVTRDEFGEGPIDLSMRLTVDGEVRQEERTRNMHWSVDHLLLYVDERTRLGPGDILFTGTPAGIGFLCGRCLEPGSVVEATIEKIGTLRNVVGRRPARHP